MKLLTYTLPGSQAAHLGFLLDEVVVDLHTCQAWAHERRGLPPMLLQTSMFELVSSGAEGLRAIQYLINILEGEAPLELRTERGRRVGRRLQEIHLLPPLPRAMSLRDFYAFEQHVEAANANRGREVPEEWYRIPVFYFSNPNALFGANEVIPYPQHSQELDFELEVACVIGKAGMNIPAEQAEEHIFGYTIFNDWSARDLQREEMRVGLGPAKGKDFASSLGPWIVTPDELEGRRTGRPGVFDAVMTASINGKEVSRGNWKDLHYSFGEMIARASQDVFLLPGEVLGSGTVGTGCLLELTRSKGPWLQHGDLVELSIDGLGVLANRVG